ncbi:MAG: hypothetical protein RR313_07715 [Anaerovoracaceae bacterium]
MTYNKYAHNQNEVTEFSYVQPQPFVDITMFCASEVVFPRRFSKSKIIVGAKNRAFFHHAKTCRL